MCLTHIDHKDLQIYHMPRHGAPRCWASIVLTNGQLLREPTAGEGILYDSNCTAPPRMGQALTV